MMVSDIINMVLAGLVFAIWIGIAVSLIISKCAPVKTVKARVVDKYMQRTISRFFGTFRREGCVIVFEAEGKRLSFTVSEFSYDGYQIDETGTLTYKGNSIIDFE